MVKIKEVVRRIKTCIKDGPILVSQIGGRFPDMNITQVYELVWELEKQGVLICLDFEGVERSDTFCFAADTKIVQPGIKTLFYYEKDFLDAMLAKEIVSENDLNILSEEHKILFVRSLFCEMISSGFCGVPTSPTKEFVRTAITKFLTRGSGVNELQGNI